MIVKSDCLDWLKHQKENSVDSLVTDPPAGISFMGKDWDSNKGGRKEWIAWLTEVMSECARVLKPGAHGLIWAIPRTSHWTATAAEDAGFEIRDVVTHLFGSGFPKSLNVEKAGAGKKWSGWGTALKPASEHWILVRKPLSEKTVAKNVLKWGTGGINVDGCRIEGDMSGHVRKDHTSKSDSVGYGSASWQKKGTPQLGGRFPANLVLSHTPYCSEDQCDIECAIQALDKQSGANDSSMLTKAACGPAKTKAVATFAGKKTESKSGSLSIDGFGSRLTAQFLTDTISITKTGTCLTISFPIWNASKRTPIGTCIIETEKTTESFEAKSIASVSVAANGKCSIVSANDPLAPIKGTARIVFGNISESGETRIATTGTLTTATTAPGPSRFFYCAKISSSERNAGLEGMPKKSLAMSGGAQAAAKRGEEYKGNSGMNRTHVRENHHPTVKPQKLMRYLCRMITPPGGTVLDPFMGSGSTGLAALSEGFKFIGVEREAEYHKIAEARIFSHFPEFKKQYGGRK
jgi:DNA modification methylase